jgi:hypothetical protein
MKSDDEKLRALFQEKEEPTFNAAIKKARAMSILRTTLVSLMIFIIVSFILLVSNAYILNTMSYEKESSLRSWFNIAMPNAYIGNVQVDDRIMVGQINYVRYRYLGKKPIVDGNYEKGYTYMPFINGIYGDSGNYLFNASAKSHKDLQERINYNKVGKPIMKFYHPELKYENYINDLNKIDKIGSNKLAELSLSFDKAYSIEEVKAMIPKDITTNWYWVDTFADNEKISTSKSILEEYDVYGIKALDSQGNLINNPEIDFINTITRGKGNKDYGNTYEKIFNTLSKGKAEIKKEDLRIIGVVVSGDVEAIKALKDKNFIKACTIGAIADKY